MIPYYPAVYIGPNGEQFPVGYHPPPMALSYEQHQLQHNPRSAHQRHQPSHTPHHPQHHLHPQHTLHQHQHQQQQAQHPRQQHIHTHQGGPFPIHGPTSTPLSFVGSTVKLANSDGHSTLESVSTPDIHQLGSSASLGSTGSSPIGSSGDKGDSESGETNSQEGSSSNLTPLTSPSSSMSFAVPVSMSVPENQALSKQSSVKASSSSPRTGSRQTSHRPKQSSSSSTKETSHTVASDKDTDNATADNATTSTSSTAATTTTAAATASGASAVSIAATESDLNNPHETNVDQGQEEDGELEREQNQKQYDDQAASTSPGSSSSLQQQQHHSQPYVQYPSPYPIPHQNNSHPSSHQSPYPQTSHRSTPNSPYYPTRQTSGHSKPFNGQQGQGPGIHGVMALPPGAVPGHQGYGVPPYFNPNVNNAPQSPGSRRPIVYPNQAAAPPSGSHPLALPSGVRPGQQYHISGFKPPYVNQGFPQDYQHPGYFVTPEGWRPAPSAALQKKPKELDKAMWVGNVLSDTTMSELQSIFEAEPTEAEGDIQHDVPESIFILSKSNCAFVNYSSHEAVDRAVRRFHDREFKNTRLVCRPRKDPATDPYSNKMMSPGRYQQQQLQQHHGQLPYMSDTACYYGSENSLSPQRTDGGELHQHVLSEAQTRMERMRLEGSSPLGSSSSGGEGSILGQVRKNKGNSKKSRSTSSLGYTESRYFILKGLNEEDLKLSVQYGLWATQDHLVPILNEAFMNTKNVYLIFSANKSGEFFGYARMMGSISTENEEALTSGKEQEIWTPDIEIPISPELKAKMLEEIEQSIKEGKQITNEEAEVIARASTTTKSWGIRFPVRWIHVEVKVSKDGTEVDPVVGEQLLNLFIKPGQSRRGRNSISGTGSRSDSEAGGSRRSSIAGESTSLTIPETQRSTSSRRSSIMSTRSTGSTGDRRSSLDPSRTQGPSQKSTPSPLHAQNRSQFGGNDGNQPQNRAQSRHNFGTQNNHGPNTSQAPYSSSQYPDQQRQGWGSKPNYRNGGAGGYGQASMNGAPAQGGFYQQDPNLNHRKGGPGGPGGKFHPSSPHTGYEPHQTFQSPHVPRRQQQQNYPGSYRPNVPSPGNEHAVNSGYGKHEAGTSPGSGSSNQQSPAVTHDQNGYSNGNGPRITHPPHTHPAGAHVLSPGQPGGQPIPPHPGMYAGQGPPSGYPAPFPPGYPMVPPYMGYPYMPPAPFMHGAMSWHPGQGPPIAANMVPGAGLVPAHPTSMSPMHAASGGEGHVMEGMVPLIGYDGVTYAYIPAEEAYHQSMYGYGYMTLDPQAPEEANDELEAEQGRSDEDLAKERGEGEPNAEHETGAVTDVGERQLDSPEQSTEKYKQTSQSNTGTLFETEEKATNGECEAIKET
ncbi:hypothetical protein BGZ49_004590 [Haplosporangium sp. Z 27]|nr:hypothetical protein BGZ49_004590 [Haplosporangium sp. Z 27]